MIHLWKYRLRTTECTFPGRESLSCNSVIPTTLDIARQSLWHHLGTHERRFIYEETWLQPLPHYEADLAPGTEWTAWADVPSLTTLTSQ